MSIEQLAEFYDRVARYERARRDGYGFEAPGTLGRSYYMARMNRRRRSFLMPVLVTLLVLVGLKGAMMNVNGQESYDQRVALLAQGQGVDRIAAFIMMPEPASLYVAEKLGQWLK